MAVKRSAQPWIAVEGLEPNMDGPNGWNKLLIFWFSTIALQVKYNHNMEIPINHSFTVSIQKNLLSPLQKVVYQGQASDTGSTEALEPASSLKSYSSIKFKLSTSWWYAAHPAHYHHQYIQISKGMCFWLLGMSF